MSKKNIYYVSTLLLTSTIFGCKNNQIEEKVADISFFEKYLITCTNDPSKDGCSMNFNYKQEKVNFSFVRDYDKNKDKNKITIRKVGFQDNSSTGFFYGQVLSNKSHLHFPFLKFIEFTKHLNIFYSNDLNKIEIEIENNASSKDIILKALREFVREHNLKEDEVFLNNLAPDNFNYNDIKKLQFISEDFSALEAFLLELSIKNKEHLKI
ncbi:MAG: hypothetical protein DCC88_10365 [Spirobacillus cienkowskii]|jgi:hypothetical protein|uniref:Lipoprotein n=1 Tax=Spirobacillus cienkowskii TaxID=495820 RepID=A0A369KPB1_9BACT|nr:MAG: hypothetical protein DCC88_10365 [Spirobacillus cienkowskii]